MTNSYLFTSESVSEGHPDKVCDRISDAVVDAFLATEDPLVRVACETLVTTNKIVLAGEVRGPQELVDKDGRINKDRMVEIARNSVKAIGYDQEGFSWKTADVDVYLHGQSADIAMGVDASGNKDEGAGDQGIMFGFACDETENLMPAPIEYSHRILQRMAQDRHSGAQPKFGPDAKSQVTLRYENGKPVGCTAVVVSTQHAEDVDTAAVREMVRPYVEQVLPEGWMPPEDEFYVNPTGRFVIGGPDGDAGLTGRKIIVDTYGGAAPHGGGAFSGKDPTKVDRSAAYYCRWIAKSLVAAGLCRRCLVQVSYAIGVAEPLSVFVDSYGSVKNGKTDEYLMQVIKDNFDMRAGMLVIELDMKKPKYKKTAAYGHFGNAARPADPDFTWEVPKKLTLA